MVRILGGYLTESIRIGRRGEYRKWRQGELDAIN